MKAIIPEDLWKLEKNALATFGADEQQFQYRKYQEIDLSLFSREQIAKLLELIEPHTSIRGVGVLKKDLRAWSAVLRGEMTAKPRNVQQFKELASALLDGAPGHRLYFKDPARNVWFAHYVNEVEYHPEHRERNYFSPEKTEIELIWVEFGRRQRRSMFFEAEDCIGFTTEQALARVGLFIETNELRTQYLAEVDRFNALVGRVGLQVWGRGVGTDDLDGNPDRKRWFRGQNHIRLDHNGDPVRLVIDVFRETDKEEEDRESGINLWFWAREHGRLSKAIKLAADEEKRTEEKNRAKGIAVRERQELDIEDTEERPEVEIPIHPILATFDMKRHVRLRVHVGGVTEYDYDTTMSTRLILPDEVRSLIEMLVANKGIFRDIVAGKGGGAVVLCAGPPGCGKTLSAEVYAETMQRPLYSVQCSQLGLSPDELETELMKVFQRSQRWNAILLLDEADVYIAARGNDLTQNAIVGVFLRVLEYYGGILFLTTNRSDLVDDAIASRCIARINYTVPSASDQHKIWRVLADTAGIPLDESVIKAAVARFPRLSGRDVKNLLKLAWMVSESKQQAIDLAMIDFVKRFKPTGDTEPTLADRLARR